MRSRYIDLDVTGIQMVLEAMRGYEVTKGGVVHRALKES